MARKEYGSSGGSEHHGISERREIPEPKDGLVGKFPRAVLRLRCLGKKTQTADEKNGDNQASQQDISRHRRRRRRPVRIVSEDITFGANDAYRIIGEEERARKRQEMDTIPTVSAEDLSERFGEAVTTKEFPQVTEAEKENARERVRQIAHADSESIAAIETVVDLNKFLGYTEDSEGFGSALHTLLRANDNTAVGEMYRKNVKDSYELADLRYQYMAVLETAEEDLQDHLAADEDRVKITSESGFLTIAIDHYTQNRESGEWSISPILASALNVARPLELDDYPNIPSIEVLQREASDVQRFAQEYAWLLDNELD